MTHRGRAPVVAGRRLPPAPVRTNARIDDLLREWRAAKPGRCVGSGPGGVVLFEPEAGSLTMRFADADAAIEYLTRP